MNKLVLVWAMVCSSLISAFIKDAQTLLNQNNLAFIMRTVRNNSTHNVQVLDNNHVIIDLNPGNVADINRKFGNFDPIETGQFQSGSFSIQFPGTEIDELWVTVQFDLKNNACSVEALLNQMITGFARQLNVTRLQKSLSKDTNNHFYIDVDIQPTISQSVVKIEAS